MSKDLNIALIMRLVNQVSGPARAVREDLGQIDAAAARVEGAGGRVSRRSEMALGAAKMAVRGVAIAATAATAATGGAIAQAATMQDAWSDANKTLGLSAPALAEMQAEVDRLSVKIPVARRGLVDIVATAGQIGIRGSEDILAFTEDAAKMSATFDVTAADAASMMGSWREQMGYSQDEVRLLADQINHLGNTTAANSASVSEYFTRIASIGDVAGLTQEEMLALGSGMIAMGRGSEVAATGMQGMLRTMTKGYDDMAGAQQDIIKRIGLGGQWDEIQTQMQTDASGALRRVVVGISELDPEQRIAAATRLFGDEATRAMGSLLSDIDALDRVIDRIPEIASAAGSMEEEYLALSDDVLDNLKRVQNAIAARTGNYGKTFLDPINSGLKAFLGFLETADQRADIFERATSAAKGFFAAFDMGGAGGLADTIDRLWRSVSHFVFGDLNDDAGEILGRMFQRGNEAGELFAQTLADIDARIAPLKEAAWGNLEKLGTLIANIAEPVGAAFAPDGVAREALAWLAALSFDVMIEGAEGAQRIYSALIDELLAFTDWAAEMIGKVDLNILGEMPDLSAVDPLLNFIDSFVDLATSLVAFSGTSLRSFFGGYFDGFAPYLEQITARLGPIASSFGNIIDDISAIMRNIARALGFLEESDAAQGALYSVGAALGDFFGGLANIAVGGIEILIDAIEWIISLIRALSDGDIGALFQPLEDFFGWLGDLSLSSLLPDISAGDVLAEIGSWFAFEWPDVLPDWNWRTIIPDLPDMSQFFGGEPEDPEPIWQRLQDINMNTADLAPWQYGQQQLAYLIEESITLSELAARYESQLDSVSGRRREQVEILLETIRLEQARFEAEQNLGTEPGNTFTLADVQAETAAVESLHGKVIETLEGARALSPMVEDILAGTRSIAGIDLTAEGAQLMDSFAAGIRQGTDAVIAAVQAMTARLDAALPQGGQVQLAIAGPSPAIEGRRDGGGPVRRGRPYLVGERYPEIMVPDSDGTIVPPWALNEPRLAPGAGRIAARAATPARVTRIHVDRIEVKAQPGQDAESLAREILARLHAQNDGDDDDGLHDGGMF